MENNDYTIVVKNTRDNNLRTFDSFEEAVEWMKMNGKNCFKNHDV